MADQDRSVGGYIKGVGAFGILVAIFMAGFGISHNNWTSLHAQLQNDLRHAQEDATKARAELGAAKTEFVQLKAASINAAQPGSPLKDGAGAKADANLNEITINIPRAKSVTLFDGKLLISLIATPYEGDPLRHTVVATIGSPGHPNLDIDRKDVGYVTEYKASDTFRIRITEASTFDATFLATRVLSRQGD